MVQWVTDTKKIGLGLTTFGVIFLVLGVLLFFDRPLIIMGNILFTAGTITLIGFQRCSAYFFDPKKIRGTICFIAGFLLILFKHPVIGMFAETFGIANLFGNFFPAVLSFLRKLPGLQVVLNLPVIKSCLDRLAGESMLITND